MTSYSIRIKRGGQYNTVGAVFDQTDPESVWREAMATCADLVADECRTLAPNSDWQFELLDGDGYPLYRIRLIADESEEPSSVARGGRQGETDVGRDRQHGAGAGSPKAARFSVKSLET